MLSEDPEVRASRRRGRHARAEASELCDEVVAAAVAGDQRAFAVIYEAVNPRLVRYLGLMVGSDADDVASETWVQVVNSLPKFVGGADKIGAWVIGVGRNRALSHFRYQKSRPQSASDVQVFAEVLESSSDTYQSTEDAEGTASALAIIASLPKDQAEAVFLRAVVGLDVNSAAEVLGKKPGAVRTAAHRGLKNLAKRLEQEQSE